MKRDCASGVPSWVRSCAGTICERCLAVAVQWGCAFGSVHACGRSRVGGIWFARVRRRFGSSVRFGFRAALQWPCQWDAASKTGEFRDADGAVSVGFGFRALLPVPVPMRLCCWNGSACGRGELCRWIGLIGAFVGADDGAVSKRCLAVAVRVGLNFRREPLGFRFRALLDGGLRGDVALPARVRLRVRMEVVKVGFDLRAALRWPCHLGSGTKALARAGGTCFPSWQWLCQRDCASRTGAFAGADGAVLRFPGWTGVWSLSAAWRWPCQCHLERLRACALAIWTMNFFT